MCQGEETAVIQSATITYFKQMRKNYVEQVKSSMQLEDKENIKVKQLKHLRDAKFRVSECITLPITILTVIAGKIGWTLSYYRPIICRHSPKIIYGSVFEYFMGCLWTLVPFLHLTSAGWASVTAPLTTNEASLRGLGGIAYINVC